MFFKITVVFLLICILAELCYIEGGGKNGKCD